MRTETKTVYIADDGTEHATKEAARRADLRKFLLSIGEGGWDYRVGHYVDALLDCPDIYVALLSKETQRALTLSR